MAEAEARWKAMAEAVQGRLEAFWSGSEQHRRRLMAALISLHLPLKPADLADWEDDPEAWFHANEGDLLESELRGIAEIVLRVCCLPGVAHCCKLLCWLALYCALHVSHARLQSAVQTSVASCSGLTAVEWHPTHGIEARSACVWSLPSSDAHAWLVHLLRLGWLLCRCWWMTILQTWYHMWSQPSMQHGQSLLCRHWPRSPCRQPCAAP